MRLWIVNHYADPPDGMATRSHDLARWLVGQGHDVSIFVSAFSHYTFRHTRAVGVRLFRIEQIEGVRYIWLRTFPYSRNDVRRVLNMVSFAVQAIGVGMILRPRPDAVIGVSVHPLAALAGYVIARIRRARFLVEVTDLWPETLVQLGRLSRTSLITRAMRGLERFLFVRAERILMLWRNTDDYVRDLGVDTSKIVWLPHGVDLGRYRAIPPYDGGASPYTIMFLGGLVHTNALDILLESAAVLAERGRTDIRLVIQGAGVEGQQLRERATRLELQNVEFRAAVPKRDIASAMAEADAFVYGLRNIPLYDFGISLNKVTDYFAAARPVIFYGHSRYDPVAIARAGFSVPPDEPRALADAIERLFQLEAAERIEMGRRGRTYLEDVHSVPTIARRLLGVLTN